VSFWTDARAIITGGAGYIGSLLTSRLLDAGASVVVIDKCLFGARSLEAYQNHPQFRMVELDVVSDHRLLPKLFQAKDAVVHLAAIVGFPACSAVGKEVAWRTNVEGTRRIFEAAEQAGASHFIFASTYSNYGMAPDGGMVSETSPLYPQSLYAETKIAAEQYLLEQGRTSRCAPVIYRFATLFGTSPRTRFDLLINQLVAQAVLKKELLIYQRMYRRSFVSVDDVCEAILLALTMPCERIRGEIFNVGSDGGNFSKEEIVQLITRYVPGTRVMYKETSFAADMRDIAVSFEKIRKTLDYRPKVSVEQGIVEVRNAIQQGAVVDPFDAYHRNANFIAQ